MTQVSDATTVHPHASGAEASAGAGPSPVAPTAGTRRPEVTAPAQVATRVIARLRDLLHRSGVQPAGWLLVVVVIAAAVVGGLTGWVELRVLAVAGGIVALAAVAFTIGRQTYQVTLRMQTKQVTVGERALGELTVVNASDRRLLPARIELPVGRRVASFGLPSLAGSASHQEVFVVPTNRRAVITVGPARTVRGDPFGLISREIHWTGSVDLYVHPRTVRIPGRTGGFIHDLEGHSSSKITNSDVSFHALREYAPGDDRRYVHWKSTARTGKLLVRQFEETLRSHLAVGLDLGTGSYTGDDEFELAVSVAGSLALQALRDENVLSVLTSTHRLRAVSPMKTLDELSGVELRSAGDVVSLSRWMLRTEPGASIIALITGAVVNTHNLRRAGNQFPPDVRVLAVRVDQGASLSVQTSGNVSVVTLGSLNDLPRAVRRAGAGDG